MTDDTTTPENTPENTPAAPNGERIAKVMARAGVASRREAERMIVEGRVTVNGRKIDSPALDILPSDKVRIDGKPMEEPQETRLWMYYKPTGLVTSASDEKGRQTVFDALPRDMPRVMTVGRLDLNSEGLLLLTNDGELKRRLEMPATGWLRRYRVRVNGRPNDLSFDPLRRGVTIEGEDFAPMEVKLDSQQGANAWLTVGIREGRNREIRRAMAHIGLTVNRLIRIGYGPFKLTGMEENEVREIKRKVLRDQLGGLLTGEVEEKDRDFRERGAEGRSRPARGREDGDRKPFARREDGDRKPYSKREDGDRKPFARREDGDRKPYAKREDGDRKPFARREDGDRKPYGKREDGDRKPFARREDGDRKPFARREDGDRKPYGKREDGDRKPFARREDGDRKPYGKREGGDRKPFARSEAGGAQGKPRWKTGDRPEGGKGARGGFGGKGGKAGGDRPSGDRGGAGRPGSDKARGSDKTRRAPQGGARPEGKGPRKPRG